MLSLFVVAGRSNYSSLPVFMSHVDCLHRLLLLGRSSIALLLRRLDYGFLHWRLLPSFIYGLVALRNTRTLRITHGKWAEIEIWREKRRSQKPVSRVGSFCSLAHCQHAIMTDMVDIYISEIKSNLRRCDELMAQGRTDNNRGSPTSALTPSFLRQGLRKAAQGGRRLL